MIGNSAYHYKPFLPNTLNDAQAMAAKFKEAGFDVVSAHNDLGYLPFKRAIRQFEDAAAEADIAVVFYAGHGIEIGGVNYMLPVDARLANTRDAHDEAITLDRLLEAVEGAKRLSLIILDACRENPFVQTMKRPRTAMMRTARLGLGAISRPPQICWSPTRRKQGRRLKTASAITARSPLHCSIICSFPVSMCASSLAACATRCCEQPATGRSHLSMAQSAVTPSPLFPLRPKLS